MRAQLQEHRGFSSLMFHLSLVTPFLLTACGGGSNSAAAPSTSMISMSVTVAPATATLPTGGSQSFSAMVAGSSNTAVSWSIAEGASGGTIDNNGLYTAPQASGTYHVLATSQADTSKSAMATVTVSLRLRSMTAARAAHSATLLNDGKVLIAGGFGDGFRQLASAELYDPSSGAFIPTGDMTTARARHTATLLANGKVLIAGGVIDTQQGTYLVSAEIYDPTTGTFSPTGNLISGGWSRSTLLPDGRAFIAEDGNAELYDPASGTFALTGAYASPTSLADTVTLLPSGQVLVAAGCGATCDVNGATEVFDPKTGAFSLTGPRSPPGWPSTATLLMNGTVLFVEADDSAFPDQAELYDPTSGTFTQIGRTHSVHEFSTATRLPDLTVLIAGGQLPGGNGSTAVELYDPATRTFANAANLILGRHEHTATLLPDGTVLIAGGYSIWAWPNVKPSGSAEIYKE